MYLVLYFSIFFILRSMIHGTEFTAFPIFSEGGYSSSTYLNNGQILTLLHKETSISSGIYETYLQKNTQDGELSGNKILLTGSTGSMKPLILSLINGGFAVIFSDGTDYWFQLFDNSLTVLLGKQQLSGNSEPFEMVMMAENSVVIFGLGSSTAFFSKYSITNSQWALQNKAIFTKPVEVKEMKGKQLKSSRIMLGIIAKSTSGNYAGYYLYDGVGSPDGSFYSLEAETLVNSISNLMFEVIPNSNAANNHVYVMYIKGDNYIQGALAYNAKTTISNFKSVANLPLSKDTDLACVSLTEYQCLFLYEQNNDVKKEVYIQVIALDGSLIGSKIMVFNYEYKSQPDLDFLGSSKQPFIIVKGEKETNVVGQKLTGELKIMYPTGGCERFLNTDRTVCSTINDCKTYLADGAGCSECYNQRSVNIAHTICEITNCLTYDESSLCKTCLEPLKVSNNKLKCYATFADCGTYDDNGVCNTCADNSKILSTNKLKCYLPVNECEAYDENGFCTACKNSKLVSTNKLKCYLPFADCSTYDENGICIACKDTTKSVSNDKLKCYLPVNECDTYDENGVCTACKNSKLVSTNKLKCYMPFTDCSTYNENGDCTICTDALKSLSSNKLKCYLPVNECETYDENGFCTACKNSKLVSTNKLKCYLPFADCSTYDENGICIACKDTSKSVSNDKLKCYLLVNECDTYDENGVCTACKNSKLVSTNKLKCYQPFTDCSNYNENGDCTTCLDTSKSVSSNKLKCYLPVNECETYDENGVCTTCKNNKIVSTNKLKCYLPFVDCGTYEENGICITCTDTSKSISINKLKCYLPVIECDIYDENGVCTACKNSKIVSTNKLKCYQPFTDCSNYNENGECSTCLDTSKSVSSNKLKCYLPVNECDTYDENGVCTTCKNSKFVSMNKLKCYLSVIECDTYDGNGVCLTCKNSKLVSTNKLKCYLHFSDCVNFDNNGVCEACTGTSKILSTNKLNCYLPVNECDTYDENGFCTACKNSKLVSTNKLKCYLPFADCSTYDDDGICIVCADTSKSISNNKLKCYIPVDECDTYDGNGVCVTCKNSKLVSTNKLKCYLHFSDCVTYDDNGVCHACTDTSKILSTNKLKCYLPVNDCDTYDENGICKTCKSIRLVSSNKLNCYIEVIGCSEVDANGVCKGCINRLILSDDKFACVSVIPNCVKHSNKNDTCSECLIGYEISYNKSKCTILKNLNNTEYNKTLNSMIALNFPKSNNNTHMDTSIDQEIYITLSNVNGYKLTLKEPKAVFYSEAQNKSYDVPIKNSLNPGSLGIFDLSQVKEDYYSFEFTFNVNKTVRILENTFDISRLPDYFIMVYQTKEKIFVGIESEKDQEDKFNAKLFAILFSIFMFLFIVCIIIALIYIIKRRKKKGYEEKHHAIATIESPAQDGLIGFSEDPHHNTQPNKSGKTKKIVDV